LPNLGTGVERRTRFGLGQITIRNDLRHVQVPELKGPVGCPEDVGWFDVAVDDVIFMQEFES
jgi:hypothetical protein